MSTDPASSPGPERPRLRPLEAFPVLDGPEPLLALRDPSRIAQPVSLPPGTVAVVQLFDGDSTRDEICALYEQRYSKPLPRARLDALIQKLDEALLLDSDHFRRHSASVHAAFRDNPIREALLAGVSYPEDPGALATFLDGCYEPPHGPGAPHSKTGALPKLIVTPHIDYSRGGPAYAWAFRPLAQTLTTARPELVVIFGTDHVGAQQPFSLTRKHYATPLGQLTTDIALVDALVQRVTDSVGARAAQDLFSDEHHHRTEHSIELAAVWLRHTLGDAAANVKVLPILCGALEPMLEAGKDPSTEPVIAVLLSALEALTQGRRVLVVAAADLAHVGPRFGDEQPLSTDDRASLERRDQETLRVLETGSASAWIEELWRDRNQRRICGLAPVYHSLLVTRPGHGTVACYAQCPAEGNGGTGGHLGDTSIVSIASLCF
ncbi:MAG: AmmeMemoRadiSam system protein B [Polyangia bacterium]